MELSNIEWGLVISITAIIGYVISYKYKTWIVWGVLLLHPFILGFILLDALIPTVTFVTFAFSSAVARLDNKYNKIASKLIKVYLFFYNINDYSKLETYLKENGFNIRRFDENDLGWDIPIADSLWRLTYYRDNKPTGLSLSSFNLIGQPNRNKFKDIHIGVYKTDDNKLNLYMNGYEGKEEKKLALAFITECKKNNIKCNVHLRRY